MSEFEYPHAAAKLRQSFLTLSSFISSICESLQVALKSCTKSGNEFSENVQKWKNKLLKGAQSYFSKFSLWFHLKNHHSKDINLKLWLETVKLFGCTKQIWILQLPISYCISSLMVTITRHIFINIFQMEHFSAVKFAMGYEKNMSFLVIPISPKVWKKKLKR